MPKFHQKQPTLRYVPLGGVGTTLNKNLHVYETEEDILIVDCGVAFPEAEELGVDVIIPDVSYLKSPAKRDKIRGIVITHGNYDHFAALPYILPEIGFPPIYAAKLTRGFIQNSLDEFNLLKGQSLHLVEPETGRFELGQFKITTFRVNHSVPDTMGLFMETPAGNFVHTPDYKFDWTPADNKKFEIQKLASLAREKRVLCLMSDSLGATRDGYALSERFIQPTLERFIQDAPGQVFVTTISSNINRIQQIVEAAVKFKRKVIPLGRSIRQNVEMARNLGYLTAPPGVFADSHRLGRLAPRQRLYLVAGSFGQRGSALDRLARQDNQYAKVRQDDMVIFSAQPIPGTYDEVDRVIDLLTEMGAHVIYSEIQTALHTSGHGGRGDIALLANLVEPKYFVPTGGTFKHMRAFSFLLEELGYPRQNILEVKEGQILEFSGGKASLVKQFATKKIFVDGTRIGDVGSVVLRDRQRLAEAGIFTVVVQKDRAGDLRSQPEQIEIISRGFVYMAEAEELIEDVKKLVAKQLRHKKGPDWPEVRKEIERRVSRFIYSNFGREPLILVILIET